MPKAILAKKGIALIVAIMTVLVVVGVAATVMAIIGSESRLTFHQTSRIRAYYAALAGINYTLEKIRRGTWPIPASGTTREEIWDKADSDLPYTVTITLYAQGAEPPSEDAGIILGCAPITAKVDYTYSAP